MTTQTPLLLGMVFAVGAGIAISLQSVIINAVGGSVGPVRTAFFIHAGGAVVGAVMLGLLVTRRAPEPLPGTAARMTTLFLFAGLMGMITLPAIALSFPRVGLVAGQFGLIAGQSLIALLVDTLGLAGADAIPLTWQRVLGLGLMVLAVWLLLPKGG